MASLLRHARARALGALFKAHGAIYEASGGRIGASMGLPVLLLTVTGRKSGARRTAPLVYFEDGEALVVVGSDGGARRHPQWWKNLQVNPSATVRVGRRVFEVTARLAQGAERERLWAVGMRINPAWDGYQRHTERLLPVVVLEAVDGLAAP